MKFDKDNCPVIEVEGYIAAGKQYDLDITLPKDDREVIYGVVKDSCGDPIKDAVVKLIEIDNSCGKEERKPVSHTFTDKHGEFVFGPLCSDRYYAVEIWANKVRHSKICKTCQRDGSCLKGVHMDCHECVRPCEEGIDPKPCK